MKRIVAFIFVLLTVFSLIPFSALAGDAQTGILAELAGATVGGAAFDLGDYPKKDGASAELLAFMERNYRYDGDQSDYRMEVYIYNPSEKAIVTGGKNMIEMAVKFDENGVAEDYEKFNLRFLEKTENNRFYKFAVVDHVSAHDGNKIVSRVDRAVRRYTVSGFEVQYVGASNGIESPVGKSFRFVGYQSEKNLSVSTGLVETIELDVHQTYWRSQTSSLGEGHQNQLTSVYFAVPEKYFDKYGVLQAVKAGWNEQKTAPIVIVDNQSVYTGLKSFLGVDAAGCQYGFYDEQGVYNGSGTTYFYRYIYNVEKPWNIPTMYFKDYISPLPYVFYDANITIADIGVSGPVLRKHIQGYQYADWLFADAVDEGRKKGYQEQIRELERDNLALSQRNQTTTILSAVQEMLKNTTTPTTSV
jgi:hypothetical protein